MDVLIDMVCSAWSSGGSQRFSVILLGVLIVCQIINVLHLISITWTESEQSRDHASRHGEDKPLKPGKESGEVE